MVVANAVLMAHQFILPKLATASHIVDATAGNGKDTLFLAKNSNPSAVIWAFDIQQQALQKTETLLTDHKLRDKVKIIFDSHANITNHIHQPLDVVMFNLGYLPGGDQSINTSPDTTIKAIAQSLKLLTVGGLMTIAAYPGYEHGRLENQAVREYLTSLRQETFAIACWSMVNQRNNPPVLYIIEKMKE